VTHPLDDASELCLRRADLLREFDRSSRTVGTSSAVLAAARRTVATSRALVDHAALLREARFAGRSSGDSLRNFELVGIVEGARVHARFERGRLTADPVLRRRAQFVVDLRERWQREEGGWYLATLDGGPATAVLLTLIRACDSVESCVLGPIESHAA
jgi:hypothetical protein